MVFDTLPLELEYMQDGYISGLVGQKYWGWGYDTVQMVCDKIVNGAEYDSFNNSGMDIVDPCNVDIMAEMWAQQDFTIELPPPALPKISPQPPPLMKSALRTTPSRCCSCLLLTLTS